MDKKSLLCQKIRRRFIFRVNWFLPTGRYGPMYAACAGIRQSIFARREKASRVLRTKVGSMKKFVNLTLIVNCAETVRPSDMMPETKNMRQSILLATVKTATFYLKRRILEKFLFVTGVMKKCFSPTWCSSISKDFLYSFPNWGACYPNPIHWLEFGLGILLALQMCIYVYLLIYDNISCNGYI